MLRRLFVPGGCVAAGSAFGGLVLTRRPLRTVVGDHMTIVSGFDISRASPPQECAALDAVGDRNIQRDEDPPLAVKRPFGSTPQSGR
jgi:hypothetical protein